MFTLSSSVETASLIFSVRVCLFVMVDKFLSLPSRPTCASTVFSIIFPVSAVVAVPASPRLSLSISPKALRLPPLEKHARGQNCLTQNPGGVAKFDANKRGQIELETRFARNIVPKKRRASRLHAQEGLRRRQVVVKALFATAVGLSYSRGPFPCRGGPGVQARDTFTRSTTLDVGDRLASPGATYAKNVSLNDFIPPTPDERKG